MVSREPIDPSRVRRIEGSFSWLDHRLVTDGFLGFMKPEEMLLYFFLVLVGDRNGISFYSYDRIATLLKMDIATLDRAIKGLVGQSLIATSQGRYQVLKLPERPLRRAPPQKKAVCQRSHQIVALGEILKQMGE